MASAVIARPLPALLPAPRAALEASPSPPRREGQTPAIWLAPLASVFQAWHQAPESLAVPLETTLHLAFPLSPGRTIEWRGVEAVTEEEGWSRADLRPIRPGRYLVEVTASQPGLQTMRRTLLIEAVHESFAAIRLSSPKASAEPVVIDASDVNGSTYRYFRGESVAAVREIAPGRYRTSTIRSVKLEIDVEPAALAPLIEWTWRRPDGGVEYRLGRAVEASFARPGRYRIAVGPPGSQQALEVEVYEVEITSHRTGADDVVDGVPITFTAVTHPAGYEQDITWLASTSHGTGLPLMATGPAFTVRFEGTYGEGGSSRLLFQWLGVRADNAAFEQDQKFDTSLQEPGVGYPDPDPLDPVHLFSGEFFLPVTDLRVEGRDLDFAWTRTYRSRLGRSTRQGFGWDFGYNLRVEQVGSALRFFDGTGRADLFEPAGDGTWRRREFFRVFSRNVDGSFTLSFPDTAHWDFLPLGDRPDGGKIARMVDRSGNTLSFDYDASGRLSVIHDTLDTAGHTRDFTVSYNAEGFISAVTDFTGRTVTYQYYDGVEAGGVAGDLKSVTSPAVTGTPSGNDFPDGKSTVYTYTSGFIDKHLNHDLLTVTDARGQVFLRNVYGHTADPADPRFAPNALYFHYDRLITQIWGDPADRIEITYAAVASTSENGLAVVQAIVNDRMGNVHELLFDRSNRLVRSRAFTARAEAGRPTTATTNRPRFVLRPEDPPFFEIRYEYNDDSLRTRTVYPNLNEEVLAYDSGNPNRLAQANVLQRCRLPGPLGGEQERICETFEHDPRFGSEGRSSFPILHIDARGNATLFDYDASGDLIRIVHRLPAISETFEYNEHGQLTAHLLPDNGSGYQRRDTLTYYGEADGFRNGYLHQEIMDAAGRALTTTYESNAVGKIVRQIDPRGNDTLFDYNQLDQVVRQLSSNVGAGEDVRYETLTFYDANDNITGIDVENVDAEGRRGANTHFSTRYEYDVLNRVVRQSEEVDPEHSVSTEFTYDKNRQLTFIRYAEAVAGRSPDNAEAMEYDALKRLFRHTRAPGGPDATTEQADYDGNGNLIRRISGAGADPHVTTYRYDGYDRQVERTDAMGNVTHLHYDANDNPVRMVQEGEPAQDRPGGGGNVRLSEESRTFDAMDRPTLQAVAHFDPLTQEPIGDGEITTQLDYTPSSDLSRTVDDRGNQTLYTFDTIYEVSQVTDAAGNQVQLEYDENRNPVRVTEIEKSGQGGGDETFTSTWEYDSLNRPRRIVDPAGNAAEYGWDSRQNLTVIKDAEGAVTERSFDGLSRPTETETIIGGGTLGSVVRGSQRWDDSSRMIAEIDGNGNQTTYTYDGQNRETGIIYANGTSSHATFNIHGNLIRTTDPNGTVTEYTYDGGDRLLSATIQRGPGVLGTTFESYQYDGLGRLTEGRDDDSVLTYRYDSEGRVLEESLNGETTSTTYDGLGNPLTLTFPGGRTVARTYDALNRLATLADAGGTIATYSYAGPQRIVRRDHRNGTSQRFDYDGIGNGPDDHGVRQVKRASSVDASGMPLVDRSFLWDATGNRRHETDGITGRTRGFDYDELYRLTEATEAAAGEATATRKYELDDAGNRTLVIGGPAAGAYTLGTADRQVNQYTATPFGARSYDAQGNLTGIDSAGGRSQQLAYDSRDHLVLYSDAEKTVVFTYDVMGRMVSREVTRPAAPLTETTRYFYADWQVIEEQDGTGATTATYVHGPYLDEVVSMQRGGEDYFFHTDDLFTVLAVTDSSGQVAERYAYGDFGEPAFLDANGASRPGSAIGNPILFTGHRYLPEIGLYFMRTRFMDPRLGRFTSRDGLGIWGDPSAQGNGFTYAGNNPSSRRDPTGQYAALDFVDCNAAQRFILRSSTSDAQILAMDSHVYLQLLDPITRYCDGRYLKWFGWPSDSYFGKVREKFRSTAGRFFSTITFNCSDSGVGCRKKRITFAYVNPKQPDTIFTCTPFWFLPPLPIPVASQAPTIVHEVTHMVASTNDEAYGPVDCAKLAWTDRDLATQNADNYRWFAEDYFPLSCNPLANLIQWALPALRAGGAVVDLGHRGVGFLGGFATRLGVAGANAAADAAKTVGSTVKNGAKTVGKGAKKGWKKLKSYF